MPTRPLTAYDCERRMPMKLFLIAVSLRATIRAGAMASLKDLARCGVSGVGGPAMQAQGLVPLSDGGTRRHGIWEVLPKYRALKARIVRNRPRRGR